MSSVHSELRRFDQISCGLPFVCCTSSGSSYVVHAAFASVSDAIEWTRRQKALPLRGWTPTILYNAHPYGLELEDYSSPEHLAIRTVPLSSVMHAQPGVGHGMLYGVYTMPDEQVVALFSTVTDLNTYLRSVKVGYSKLAAFSIRTGCRGPMWNVQHVSAECYCGLETLMPLRGYCKNIQELTKLKSNWLAEFAKHKNLPWPPDIPPSARVNTIVPPHSCWTNRQAILLDERGRALAYFDNINYEELAEKAMEVYRNHGIQAHCRNSLSPERLVNCYVPDWRNDIVYGLQHIATAPTTPCALDMIHALRQHFIGGLDWFLDGQPRAWYGQFD